VPLHLLETKVQVCLAIVHRGRCATYPIIIPFRVEFLPWLPAYEIQLLLGIAGTAMTPKEKF